MKRVKDELLFIAVLQFFLFCLTSIDYIVNFTLYRFGLRFDYEWANIYWTLLGLIWISVALLATSAYFIDRLENVSATQKKRIYLKGGLIGATVLAEHYGGFLDTLFFGILKILGHPWSYAWFENWWWHPYSKIFGFYAMPQNIVINLITVVALCICWWLVDKRK